MSFYPEPTDTEVSSLEDGPCPVCGAPNRTCAGPDCAMVVAFTPSQPHDDPLAPFFVRNSIYPEFQLGICLVKKLLYPKGALIRPEEAKRLGLIPE